MPTITTTNNNRDRGWGTYFGFPECCIEAYCNGWRGEDTHNLERRLGVTLLPWSYNPCPDCIQDGTYNKRVMLPRRLTPWQSYRTGAQWYKDLYDLLSGHYVVVQTYVGEPGT